LGRAVIFSSTGMEKKFTSSVKTGDSTVSSKEIWCHILLPIENTAVGTVKFPPPATYQEGSVEVRQNMRFMD
jgi:hypothetical protein